MNSGLDRILAKIADDPSNKVLTDRFVALVSELGTDQDKANYILKLSKALKEPDPRAAMEYAFTVFQYDQKNLEALEIISASLKILGRLGKSEVIKNEIAKIRKLQRENKIDHDMAEQFVTEVSAIRFDHIHADPDDERDVEDEIMDSLPDDAFIPDIHDDPKATVPLDPFRPKPMPQSPLADPNRPQQEQVKLNLQLAGGNQKVTTPRDNPKPAASIPVEPMDVAPIGTVINSTENFAAHARPAPQRPQQPTVPPEPAPPQPKFAPPPQQQSPAPQPIPNRSGPPPAAAYHERGDSTVIRDEHDLAVRRTVPPQPKKPEEMPASWKGPELKVLVEQFEFYFKQQMYADAETLLADTESHARQLTWWKARRAILDTISREKRFPPEESKDPSSEQSAANDTSSGNDDSGQSTELRAWVEEVEAMIDAGKSRKAMTRIRKDLAGKTDIMWGMAAYEKMTAIWEELGLHPFNWEPGDGMPDLVTKLKKRQPARLANLVGKLINKKVG